MLVGLSYLLTINCPGQKQRLTFLGVLSLGLAQDPPAENVQEMLVR